MELKKIENIQHFNETGELVDDQGGFAQFRPLMIAHLERHPKFVKQNNMVLDIFNQLSQLSHTKTVWINTYFSFYENLSSSEVFGSKHKKQNTNFRSFAWGMERDIFFLMIIACKHSNL